MVDKIIEKHKRMIARHNIFTLTKWIIRNVCVEQTFTQSISETRRWTAPHKTKRYSREESGDEKRECWNPTEGGLPPEELQDPIGGGDPDNRARLILDHVFYVGVNIVSCIARYDRYKHSKFIQP